MIACDTDEAISNIQYSLEYLVEYLRAQDKRISELEAKLDTINADGSIAIASKDDYADGIGFSPKRRYTVRGRVKSRKRGTPTVIDEVT